MQCVSYEATSVAGEKNPWRQLRHFGLVVSFSRTPWLTPYVDPSETEAQAWLDAQRRLRKTPHQQPTALRVTTRMNRFDEILLMRILNSHPFHLRSRSPSMPAKIAFGYARRYDDARYEGRNRRSRFGEEGDSASI